MAPQSPSTTSISNNNGLESTKKLILHHQIHSNHQIKLTEEEEKTLSELLELVEDEAKLKRKKKYALKSLLIIPLRMCQMDANYVLKMLQGAYELGCQIYYDLFRDIDPCDLIPVLQGKYFRFVKRTNDQGPLILHFRIRDWSPSEVTKEKMFLTGAVYVAWLAVYSPQIQRQGVICVGDVGGVRFEHLRQLSFHFVKRFMDIYKLAPPFCKGLIGYNTSRLFDYGYKMWSWLFPEALTNLIHITQSVPKPSYFKDIDPTTLPKELGGTIPDNEAYMEGLEEKMISDKAMLQYAQLFVGSIHEIALHQRK